MTYRGHIKNGQIHFDEPVRLPEGAVVDVAVVEDELATSREMPPSQEKLRRLAAKHRPPQSWYDQTDCPFKPAKE
jgi:hypothetical protein